MSKIVIITGPSGAGKSTVAKEISEHLQGTWALISQDGVREHVKAGYRHADGEWDDETKRQWEASIAICCDMIRRYREANINCVVDIFAPPSEFEKWSRILKELEYKLIVLLPSIDKAVHRNANRELMMKESKIRENHAWFTKWESSEAVVIDTTNQTIAETVESIEAAIGGQL